jgi:hypothetical protein
MLNRAHETHQTKTYAENEESLVVSAHPKNNYCSSSFQLGRDMNGFETSNQKHILDGIDPALLLFPFDSHSARQS